jgi:phenylacetic acid degradation operon negative regulatory protein
MDDNVNYLSIIRRVPLSYFIYSAFSYFGSAQGGELPGGWFVKALARAGREESAVRQTLYRMERDGELTARRQGRMKFYSPTAYARAEIEAGRGKIFESAAEAWDGKWTLVRVGMRTPELARERERVIALLAVEGFARVDANLFAHPRSAADRLYASVPRKARGEVLIFRGEAIGESSTMSLLRLWRLDELAERYSRSLGRLMALDRATASDVTDRDAFLMRFAVVFEHLEIAWDDPGLPADLLPVEWPGQRARRLAADLYERFLPGATRVAMTILEETLPRTRQTRREHA